MKNLTNKPLPPDARDRASALFAESGHLLDAGDRALVINALMLNVRIDRHCCGSGRGLHLYIPKYTNVDAQNIAGVLWHTLQ